MRPLRIDETRRIVDIDAIVHATSIGYPDTTVCGRAYKPNKYALGLCDPVTCFDCLIVMFRRWAG